MEINLSSREKMRRVNLLTLFVLICLYRNVIADGEDDTNEGNKLHLVTPNSYFLKPHTGALATTNYTLTIQSSVATRTACFYYYQFPLLIP